DQSRDSCPPTCQQQAQRAPSRLPHGRDGCPGKRRIRLARREAPAARQLLDVPPRAERLRRAPYLVQRALAQGAESSIVDVTRIELGFGGDERGAAERLTDDPRRLAAPVEVEIDQERELHRIDEVLRPPAAPDVASDERSCRWARATGEILVMEEVFRNL